MPDRGTSPTFCRLEASCSDRGVAGLLRGPANREQVDTKMNRKCTFGEAKSAFARTDLGGLPHWPS
jgi:hypothetical protein